MDRESSHSTLQQRFGRRAGDRRHDRKSSGFGRVLIVVYWVFSLSAGVRSLYQLATEFSLAPLAILLSTLSAAIYVVATVALSRNGAGWHRVATAAVLVELVGVLGVGLLSVVHDDWFPKASVWSGFGAGYGYIPLVLPVVGLAWLWLTRPSRAER
ncbi:fatty acid desaturase [Kocuria rhizophila]|nr:MULTISPECIES: hypothetical protein [Kocuria]ASE10212.2 hypothetical protein CEP81_00055 [Kocuria rhizophila]MBK4119890.1 hypothetical protein [Kocuria rhizophila]MCC5674129.1 hypothetical protein [Kocuria rhizophila]MDV5999492.1 hypothetical protein [Kocuria rhizophila]WTI33428.1 hypothetical protein OH817_01405 [Kocuria rhizophila]